MGRVIYTIFTFRWGQNIALLPAELPWKGEKKGFSPPVLKARQMVEQGCHNGHFVLARGEEVRRNSIQFAEVTRSPAVASMTARGAIIRSPRPLSRQ